MRLIALSFLIPLLLAVAPAGWAADPGATPFAAKLDRLMNRKPLAAATVGMLVVRASDGETLYEHGADRLMIPASNQKILTTLASLSRFGPTHRFTTRIWADRPLDAAGFVNELLVEGGGDPVTNSEDWWRLAANLRFAGLRGVRGDLRVDDQRFEGPSWHPSWGRISARAYHAPVGALTANYGQFFVSVWPSETVGDPANVLVDPPVDYLRVNNRAKTAKRGARARLSVDRAKGRLKGGPGDEVVQVDGIARVGDDMDQFPRSVLDPGLYAGSLLAYQLEANGVSIEGEVKRAPRSREAQMDAAGNVIAAEDFTLIHEHKGRSISEAVMLCMKYSSNPIAESLVKNLGAWDGASLLGEPAHAGSWERGVRALRSELSQLGVDLGDARIVDGSGLSVKNRVSPRVFVRALDAARRSFGVGAEFMASMPIAELDGTLEKRLRGQEGRIRAKTGLLSDASVTSLSGYAERADGEVLIFSILVNGYSGGAGAAMDAVDRLAATLLEVGAR